MGNAETENHRDPAKGCRAPAAKTNPIQQKPKIMSLLRPELNRPSTLDEWLRDYFFGDDFFGLSPRGRASRADRFSNLPADVYEDTDGFHAVMELPGVAKEDISVEVENAVIRVSGKHTDKLGETETTYDFDRSLALPDTVNPATIRAEMRDGLLHLVLPKREETKPRPIQVQ